MFRKKNEKDKLIKSLVKGFDPDNDQGISNKLNFSPRSQGSNKPRSLRGNALPGQSGHDMIKAMEYYSKYHTHFDGC